MLELRDQPEELKRGGAKTMTEMVDRFHRSLDNIDRVTDALLECRTGKSMACSSPWRSPDQVEAPSSPAAASCGKAKHLK